MARYGVDYYGLVVYGAEESAFIEFDASPFTATPIGYKKILLEWTSPSGDWSRIRLVRNTYGFPLSVDDGNLVYEEVKNFDEGFYEDDGANPNSIGLGSGIAYHYGLFVLDNQTDNWVEAGRALAISIKDYGTLDYMINSIPAIYRTTNLNSVTDSAENEDLKNFLTIFAISLDLYKTNAELIRKSYDTSVAFAPIIPVMMQQFGIAYEPELGLQQSRILLRNIAYIDKSKGSLEGIENFVKAFTGYDQVTVASKNIMLDYNDSSFEESIGNWAPILNCTLVKDGAPNVAPYSEPSLPSLFPNKTSGVLKVNCLNGGDAELACGLSSPKTKGIPVKEGFVYTFSIYTQAASSTKRRQVHLDIRWYDRNGQEISRAGEVSALDPFGSWGRVAVTDTAPVDCYFAVPTIRYEGSQNNEHHWLDAAQFEISETGATDFAEARGITITLKATRVNELKNPGFETEILPWTATGANVSRTSLIKDEDRNSLFSLQVESTTNDLVELLYDDFMRIEPGFWYSASSYIRTGFVGEQAEDLLGNWQIDWYDANKTFLSSSTGLPTNLTEFYNVTKFYRTQNVLTVYTSEATSLLVGQNVRLLDFLDPSLNGDYAVVSVSGQYFQIISLGADLPLTYVTGNVYVQDLKLDFVRSAYSAVSPTNAKYAKIKFVWDNPQLGQVLNMDSCMFERTTIAKPYFDGSTGFSSTDDLIWEGTPYQSRSHYYKNRIATQLRLIKQLPSYLLNGTPFTILLAQPEE